MIPSLVAGEVRETLLDYLKTTWSLADQDLERALLEFLGGKDGIFKGPYARLALPFERAPDEARIPLDIPKPYTPYIHQLKAWQRLSTQDGATPDPTLVVTGTGSGKTEAFLMPILDHCLRAKEAGERGIKAIVLYPMNALAADQARRMADVVWGKDDEPHPMRNKLRVGMYVGGEGDRNTGHRVMGREHVIDVAKQLLIDPPDILLTNYRMLDFLLLRPKDRPLWQHNGPDTLRYLVLDELHTYDGAQGTDVACLIRRLKARLGGGKSICPVGTSATVSSGHGDGHAPLLDFASKIFGTPIPDDSVIGETRRTPADFCGLFGKAASDVLPADTAGLVATAEDGIESYMARVARTWFPKAKRLGGEGAVDRRVLADMVMSHALTRQLIDVASTTVLAMSDIDVALAQADPAFAERSLGDRALLVDSLMAMLSWAKHEAGGVERPLLSVQVQMWIREARRLVREVCTEPRFVWREDRPEQEGDPLALPMYFCRSCGHSGWVTAQEELVDSLVSDVVEIGRKMLGRRRELRYLHTDEHASGPETLAGIADYVCKVCKSLGRDEVCKGCGGACLLVHVHSKLSKGVPPRDLQSCPACGTDSELGILASRAASLASVAVGHLYSTPFNSDKKLLAFSDSVQDASHRAGFFSGRTYRMGLRRAMLAVIPAGETVPLLDVADRMWTRWTGERSVPASMAAFWPRDLEYIESYGDYMDKVEAWGKGEKVGKEPALKPRLKDDLLARLSWEVNREFGVAARVGRTLERSGCAAIDLDPERFEAAMALVTKHLPEKLGVASGVGEPAWRMFIAGLLQRLRLRGGVFDELLRGYFQKGGDRHHLKKEMQPLMSPFGQYTTKPTFWSSHESEHFDHVFPSGRANWYSDWVDRALGLSLRVQDTADIYRELMPLLFQADLLEQHKEGKRTYWGLAPEALRLGRDSEELRCSECGFEYAALVSGPMHVVDGACLRFRCTGRMQLAGDEDARLQSYYRRFYQRAELSRVWAAEHTGLLARQDREGVEFDFQHNYRPDAPNMLSCTPTLEMGIDIGDLSATMLMSVPPTPSSYLQRIGRAGRKTGNALVLTVTSIKPHDRYFFETPEAAMAGRVDPPGCYLDAPEILKRQALAFCMDDWTRSGKTALPGQVRDLITGDEKTRFPQPLFAYVEEHRQELIDGFFSVFKLGPETEAKLREFMQGSGAGSSEMEGALLTVCKAADSEREELRRVRDRLRKQIQQIESGKDKVANAEDELKELKSEAVFVRKALNDQQSQYALGYFCERGVLPNYAFPETGVKLQAFVSAGPGGGRAKERPSIVRAARTAIRELAPFNSFYNNSIKVKIDNLDVGARLSKRSGDAIREWQFCSECGHMEEVRLLEADEHCPRCKAADWREKGRQRKLVRMKTVAAYARAHEANFSDESDERDKEYYETRRFYDSAPGEAKYARVNKEEPFGFELQPGLIQREVNFGRQAASESTLRLGGEEVPEVKFIVCSECGQVHAPKDDSKRGKESRHRPWCKSRAKAVEKQPMEEIHLYREVKSEALLVLLPVAMLETAERLPNILAAIAAGLRKFFGGDPNHLELDLHSEPTLTSEGARRRFLVIYDTVPGGTGVLVELIRDGGAKLKEIFVLAKELLETCECATREGAKACYQCLYGHRRQDDLKVLDRELALRLVSDIIDRFGNLESVHSIGDLPVDQVLESELEERFWLVLQDWARATEGLVWEDLEKHQGRLRFSGHSWRVEPQMTLGLADEVAVNCRPDFVFWPEGANSDVKPIAVFADGATFHVQPDKARGRVWDDFAKRGAILASGGFRVWSFSWDDLEWHIGAGKAMSSWVDREPIRTKAQTLAGMVGDQKKDVQLKVAQRIAMEKGPVDGLFAYLKNPSDLRWRRSAGILGAALLNEAFLVSSEAKVASLVERYLEDEKPKPVVGVEGGDGDYRLATQSWGDGSGILLVHATTKDAANAHERPEGLHWVLRLDDSAARRRQKGFVVVWRQFLRAHNLLQFLPNLEVCTTEQLTDGERGMDDDEVSEATARRKRPSTVPVTTATQLQAEVLAELHETDESLWPVLEQLVAGGVAVPDITYEFGDESESEIEAGWSDERVGLYLDDDENQQRSAAELRDVGWTMFAASEAKLDELRAALGVKG